MGFKINFWCIEGLLLLLSVGVVWLVSFFVVIVVCVSSLKHSFVHTLQ